MLFDLLLICNMLKCSASKISNKLILEMKKEIETNERQYK